MAYFSGIGVHKDGFQITHEQSVNVQLLAEAVDGNKVEMEIEFGEVENLDGQFAARRMRRAQSVGFLPDTLFGIVWRFEFTRVVQAGWRF